jgi:hypothetical protein
MSRSRLVATFILPLVPLLVIGGPASAKKPKASSAPIVGWHREAGWTADCWYPPDFGPMAEGVKRMAWQETRDAIVGQWRGERNDGVSLNAQHVENLETILLSKADRIESVAKDNLEQCKAAVAPGGSNSAWESWLVSTAERLTEGECPYAPLDYTAFNYLNINAEWQNSLPVCRGDHIIIHGTDADYYQLEAGGPYINVAGDPNGKVTSSMPCNIEGCVKGALILQFTSDSGVSQVVPIGLEADFVVPEHGHIMVMINDDTLADNKYKVEKGMEHHTGIEIKPVGK